MLTHAPELARVGVGAFVEPREYPGQRSCRDPVAHQIARCERRMRSRVGRGKAMERAQLAPRVAEQLGASSPEASPLDLTHDRARGALQTASRPGTRTEHTGRATRIWSACADFAGRPHDLLKERDQMAAVASLRHHQGRFGVKKGSAHRCAAARLKRQRPMAVKDVLLRNYGVAERPKLGRGQPTLWGVPTRPRRARRAAACRRQRRDGKQGDDAAAGQRADHSARLTRICRSRQRPRRPLSSPDQVVRRS
jgi:hypothetical protein